jgi:hypothetical protein
MGKRWMWWCWRADRCCKVAGDHPLRWIPRHDCVLEGLQAVSSAASAAAAWQGGGAPWARFGLLTLQECVYCEIYLEIELTSVPELRQWHSISCEGSLPRQVVAHGSSFVGCWRGVVMCMERAMQCLLCFQPENWIYAYSCSIKARHSLHGWIRNTVTRIAPASKESSGGQATEQHWQIARTQSWDTNRRTKRRHN